MLTCCTPCVRDGSIGPGRVRAAVLLSVGAVATVATSQLPELTQRLFAIPVGVALIGLGYSLWRSTRTEHHDATIGGNDPHRMTAVAE